MLCDECKQREATIFITTCEPGDGDGDGEESRITKRNLCTVCGKDETDAMAVDPRSIYSEFPQFGDFPYLEQLRIQGEKIGLPDGPYAKPAYIFVMHGMVRAMLKSKRSQSAEGKMPRVSVTEVLEALREHAIEKLGGGALKQLHAWGIHSCKDFGEIIFTGVFAQPFARWFVEGTKKEDFDGGYDFETAFPVDPSSI